MARLYANENFPSPVVEALTRLGHDALTTMSAGNAGQAVADGDVLAFATQEKRALLTLNRRHFLRLARVTSSHAGIIVCTFDPDFDRQAAAIDAQIRKHPSLDGRILRVNRPSR
jgi:hypothetical protein